MREKFIKAINIVILNFFIRNNIKAFYKYKWSFKSILFIIIILIINLKIKQINDHLIKVGFFCNSIKNGGVERVISVLIKYFSKEKNFSNYLITKERILEGEYLIPNDTKRISLIKKTISLIEVLKEYHIDVLIYNFYDKTEIKKLNKLKRIKIIYYDHSSFLLWIYQGTTQFKNTIYDVYKNCKCVISLVPLENDYLFKKWGIKSILMDNPTTFEYDSVIPSDLSTKNIIMIGRAQDGIKRYELGIIAMKKIIEEIPRCEMNIVSFPEKNYEILIKNLSLEKKIRFVGYQEKIEIYLKNSSLHILPSLSEAYPLVLSEAKIFGIPSIICGLDYLTLSKGGTVIIYDDNPITIAKVSIKILRDDLYRKRLGKESRNSMKIRKNVNISKKWIELIKSIYKGKEGEFMDHYYNNKITEKEALIILNNQLNLLKYRKPYFSKLTLDDLTNITLE